MGLTDEENHDILPVLRKGRAKWQNYTNSV